MIRKFGLDKLHEVEEMEYIEGKMVMLVEVLAKINALHEKGYIPTEEKKLLQEKYEHEFIAIKAKLTDFLSNKKDTIGVLISKVITLHALGIEKFWLRRLYMYHEISERVFKKLMRKIENQIYRIENGKDQLKERGEDTELDGLESLVETVSDFLSPEQNPILNQYMTVRARQVTAHKVLKGLFLLEGIDFVAGRAEFKKVRELYGSFQEKARTERDKLFQMHKNVLLPFDSHLVNKSLLKTEEEIIEDLYEKEIISPKLHIRFQQDIEEGICS